MKVLFSQGSANPWVAKLIAVYQAKEKPKRREEWQVFSTSPVLGVLALVYERLRTTIDFCPEGSFRRAAIERILRRRLLVSSSSSPEGIVTGLLKELVWSGYLPGRISKKRIKRTEEILSEFLRLRSRIAREHQERFFKIFSAAIDEVLVDSSEQEAWGEMLCWYFKTHWQFETHPCFEDLLWLAVMRSMFKLDYDTLSYKLWCRWGRPWPLPWERIDECLGDPFGYKLFRFVQRRIAPFLVLRAIVERDSKKAAQLLGGKKRFKQAVEKVCQRFYQKTTRRIMRGIARSIIYILLTKVALALVLEIPVERLLYGRLAVAPLLVNLIFPPFLMFAVGLRIRPPGRDNTKKIWRVLWDFVRGQLPAAPERVVLQKSYPLVFHLLYGLFLGTVFLLTSWLLFKIGFNPVALAVFYLFVCLVLLFAYRIRWVSLEFQVASGPESILGMIVNFLSLPFLELGARLTRVLNRVNIWMYLLDFLIEAPFKLILEVLNEWFFFLRQKQEEMVEVPF